MRRRAITIMPLPKPSPTIACSEFVASTSVLTRIAERSAKRRRPISVSFSLLPGPWSHSSPEMNVVASGTVP